MYFIDKPHAVSLDMYHKYLDQMMSQVSGYDGILAIYQIGGVSTPGISDLDMVIVFEDGASLQTNPLEILDEEGRYIFIHNLYGVSQTHFIEAQKHTLFHNYKLLWGKELMESTSLSDEGIPQQIKVQIAFEFLFKMYINTTVETMYRVVKERGILLHNNGLVYDMEFLGVSSGALFDKISQMQEWRKKWLIQRPGNSLINRWRKDFLYELGAFLNEQLEKQKFYLPEQDNYKLANNMSLCQGKELKITHRGIVLPSMMGILGRKYFNVLHRINNFEMQVPMHTNEIPESIKSRFNFIKEMNKYNQDHIPHFMGLTSSLHVI